MRALAIVHQADAGLGVFLDTLVEADWEFFSWWPAMDPPRTETDSFDAVIALGGAVNPDQDAEHPWLAAERDVLRTCIDGDVPLLGVCLGAELVVQAAGGEARREPDPEIGWFDIELTDAGAHDPLLAALSPAFEAFQWHSYSCRLTDGAVELARSAAGLAAYRVGELAWGIQFHAEVTRADAEHWIRDYESDADAVRIGLDPDPLLAETEAKIAASNRLGAGICARFLELAASPGG